MFSKGIHFVLALAGLSIIGCAELGSTLVIGDETAAVDPSDASTSGTQPDPAEPADAADPADTSDAVDPSAADDPDDDVLCQYHVTLTGDGDGASWEAPTRIQDALSRVSQALSSGACSTGEIWMEKGIYTTGTIPTDTFQLVSGLTVYGGFVGNEDTISQRNLSQNTTTLSGLLDDGNRSFHVLSAQSQSSGEVRLDGLTIQSGGAVGEGDAALGGGLFAKDSRVRLVDVSFISNEAISQGGAVYVEGGVLSIERTRFVSNMAGTDGGAIALIDASLMVTGLEMISNAADRGGGLFLANASEARLENTQWLTQAARLGGALYDVGSSNLTLNQVVFQSNQGFEQGAAIYLVQTQSPIIGNAVFFSNAAPRGVSLTCDSVSQVSLSGVTMAGNIPETGANIEATASQVDVVNSILWNNSNEIQTFSDASISVSWSIAPDTVGGEQLIHQDPLFRVAPSADETSIAPDLRVQAGSPAIDSGNNELIPNGLGGVDAAGFSRLADDPETEDSGQGTAPIVDRGAFER